MAVGTLTAIAASPWAPVGVSAISALYGGIVGSRAQELTDSVLKGYEERRERAQRQARGQFTPMERSQIREAARPQLQQVNASLSSRGLGSSPAGGAIGARAEQGVFHHAQQMAIAQENIVNREAWMAASQLADEDEGFFEDIRGLLAAFQQLRANGQRPDKNVVQAVLRALGAGDKQGYSRGTDSRGDDI